MRARRVTWLLGIGAALASTGAVAADAVDEQEDKASASASCAQISDQYPEPPPAGDDRLVLEADRVLLEQGGLSSLAGSVKLTQDGKEFSAESLDYDDAQRLVHVRAESLFRNKDIIIRSESAEFDLDDETGAFNGTEFTVPERAARGSSERISLARTGTADLEQVRYTTCAPGSEAWFLEAGKVHLDYDEGLGTARNARLRFFHVPILYVPWFQFPINDQRRTGLLFPTVGDSQNTGLDIRQPVYLNFAPNYDATFTPRYMSDRGLQLALDGRYLFTRSIGSYGVEWLGHDQVTDQERDYLHFNHMGLLNRRLGLDVRYAETSDKTYFEDLGGKLDLSSITHLERSARLTYQAPASYTVQGLVQDYQTITSALTAEDDPYSRYPAIRVDALTRNSWHDTRLGIASEYDNFVRENSVQGHRVDLDPFLRFERDHLAWYARSQLDFRYTAYALHDTPAGQPDNPDRALPQFSAEGGLRFERMLQNGTLQLLEPKAFYLYVPYENQDDLPVFDSGEPDFDFTQLFARNRFSGEDRIGDANDFAIAVTGRQIDPHTGEAWISASVGQLYRLERPRVTLPGGSTPDRGATDFIGALDWRVASRWSTAVAAQWSPEEKHFNRAAAAIRYRSETQRLDLAYRYRRDLLEQADVTVSTPLAGGFRLAGRWRYSIRDHAGLDTLAGLEYETCCWAVRTSYRRYIAHASGEYNNGVYLQLEFKGLARVGSGFPGLVTSEQELE